MEIAKIIQAICSGKSRKEVYNLLSPEEKDTLNRFADNGLLKQENEAKISKEYSEMQMMNREMPG